MVREATFDVMAPIRESGVVEVTGVIAMVLFNAGRDVIQINNNLTLKPGATFNVATQSAEVVLNDRLTVHFVTSIDPILQITMVRIVEGPYSNIPG